MNKDNKKKTLRVLVEGWALQCCLPAFTVNEQISWSVKENNTGGVDFWHADHEPSTEKWQILSGMIKKIYKLEEDGAQTEMAMASKGNCGGDCIVEIEDAKLEAYPDPDIVHDANGNVVYNKMSEVSLWSKIASLWRKKTGKSVKNELPKTEKRYMAILQDDSADFEDISLQIEFSRASLYDGSAAEWVKTTLTLSFGNLMPPFTFERECDEFYGFRSQFAKWRDTIKKLKIGEQLPPMELEPLEPDFIFSVKSSMSDNTKCYDFYCFVDNHIAGKEAYGSTSLCLQVSTNTKDLLTFCEQAVQALDEVENISRASIGLKSRTIT